ncbi:aspartyl/glutamyl-tRNA amidotransferase subunit A [candidate division WOR-1 bacterium RIFOXYA2_FULL_36_21]|uniref:Glutamyl-tRNA(Gln) amidotransferase subunit A n=1 Tax=candidate division WOR-1 bacterium RIFOXYB2_FULL_36_35 TaxID=1802578 RepID=A0A1F4S0M2_UNCSA|nr:MAG: aspartyl/glutamyl-tRNA amidotransferase subunit A [candidate division WOR-1 bacterium RIFOXYA2_FULL_36_21]OGC13981.1 MAG: aspartyl/glutamyl-tRNA amidotransferase subunit A [candidate division WOR-1 bacterium RIFOXYB2_FULL_36_35]OGC16604.1 MAG: aspartyl/glutamyl-tRNA amidotransferase subunit A [candidate division WOR-1 bacterium RIFOXYA12_FULL_36_13]
MINKTAHELHDLLIEKKISSAELTEKVFAHIESVEPQIKAYITLTKEEALNQARIADEQIQTKKNITPLTGIPIAIKDNMCTKGILTTCASRILANYVSPYDATIVTKLKETGAVIIGKTNLDEFAMGSSTENSGMHITKNPRDLECVPGGSSGGSAAAVAANEAILATGSDTGGSIRQPASFCGIVGLKPTYGRISRYGLVAFASSLDQIGPLAKDVTDAAMLLQVMAGYDPKDSTSVDMPVPNYRESLTTNIKGLKIGVIKELMEEGISEDVKFAIKSAIKKYEELGAVLSEVSLPSFEYAVSTYYLIAPAEASSNLARFDGVKYGHRSQEAKDLITMYYNTRREGFGPEVKRRIILGTYALSAGYYDAYYLKALKVRTLIKQDFERAFEQCDVLISPTSPTVAFKIGEKANDPLSMYLSDIATIPVNLAGIPAISIPCGNANNLPIGLQIMGKAFDEETILKAAYAYEQNTTWHKKQ